MTDPGAEGWLYPLINYAWTQVQNIKRDAFVHAVGSDVKSAVNVGGSIAAPMTAYDWNMRCYSGPSSQANMNSRPLAILSSTQPGRIGFA